MIQEVNIVKIIIIGYLCLCLILFIFNFFHFLKFKWYIDYYNTIDKLCISKSWSKYEIESLRYNLYCFLNNIYDVKYDDIIQNYKITYATFVSFFWIFVIVYYIIPVISNIYYEGDFILSHIGGFIIIFAIVYTTVNGILESSFEKIKLSMADENNYINKYKKIYKILNAIIMFSNILENNVEFSLDKLNDLPITLDKLIENNIGSYHNLTNISKIRHEKSKAYQNLDFVKYLVLDPQSPFLLKYFKNIYIRLPDTSSYQFDFDENIYLSELLLNKKSDIILFWSTLIEIKDLIEKHKDKDNIYINIYNKLDDLIKNTNSDSIENIKIPYNEIKNLFENKINKETLQKYNANLYMDIETKLNILNKFFIYKHQENIYNDINKEIEDTLKKKGEYITVYDNDYIKYFLENQDIIFDAYDQKSKAYNDMVNEINYVGNYIYSYLIYFGIIFLIISHYIYVKINNIQYSYIIIGIIIVYIFSILLYKNYNFMKQK